MDLHLPGVQAKEEFPDRPVRILTGYGDSRIAEEAARAGAGPFMDKTEPLSAVADAAVALAARLDLNLDTTAGPPHGP